MKRHYFLMPIYFAIVLSIGLILGMKLSDSDRFGDWSDNGDGKLDNIMSLIQNNYVDSVNVDQISGTTLNNLLQSLDPHSFYIPKKDLRSVNEGLEGNFEGIGVEFSIKKDTVMVISPIKGGPSAKVGILAGDRIVMVEKDTVVGITNRKIVSMLRGKRGSKVKVGIKRKRVEDILWFEITRGEIPIYSVDVSYMVDDKTGYIKISKFSSKTYAEFLEARDKLTARGMENMIIDLRGNPGGYLGQATEILDEFFDSGILLVYTEQKGVRKKDYISSANGDLQKMPVAVLIDEGSASASEILAGAIQDNDRGWVVGRRSFGKGLVQRQYPLEDSTAIRLTVARYCTPSGRCIQKPYKENENYKEDYYERWRSGELFNQDSISVEDKRLYKTTKGRAVYGGGGIIPDFFIPVDTTTPNFIYTIINKDLFEEFIIEIIEPIRDKYGNEEMQERFINEYEISNKMFDTFRRFVNKYEVVSILDWRDAQEDVKLRLKATMARHLYGNEGFYPVIHQRDNGMAKALEQVYEPVTAEEAGI